MNQLIVCDSCGYEANNNDTGHCAKCHSEDLHIEPCESEDERVIH